MLFVPRKNLPHEIPPWVKSGTLFFLTISVQRRGSSDLVQPATAKLLLGAAQHYHSTQRWFIRLFLLMPDHAHALVAFPREERMPAVVRDWKRYTARATNIDWQDGFFDHRIRTDESWEQKAAYIRENPVRKNLAARAEEWRWVFEP